MRESLSFKNIFKRETKLATYIIVCLTIVVLSLSYAMFFKVDGNSKNQVVKAGDLEFTYENSSNEITNTTSNECFMPMTSDETSLYLGTCDYKLSVHNTGSLKGAYTIKLKANEGNTIDAEYLKVILRKQEGDTLQVVSGFESGKKVSELVDGIVIEDEEMASGSTVVYSISLYVAEDSLSGLESSVVDGIVASKISYSIEGTGLVHETENVDTLTYCEQNPETGACTILAQGETEELKFDNTDDNNLRYVGANPNNYVTFNNELWRIIGVFNNVKVQENSSSLIKLIRATSYGNRVWDTGSNNDFSVASSQRDINSSFLNSITTTYADMIESPVWNIGGVDTIAKTAIEFYQSERGSLVYDTHATFWQGKVGLIYPSDYGFAVGGTARENCLTTAISNWKNANDCKNNNWLFTGDYVWTITPFAGNSSNVINIARTGEVLSAGYASRGIWPSIYLKANVKIVSGDGSESNPFVLSL